MTPLELRHDAVEADTHNDLLMLVVRRPVEKWSTYFAERWLPQLREGGVDFNGTMQQGVTRDPLITLAHEHGYRMDERKGALDDQVVEMFACSTVAVVTPIAALGWPGSERWRRPVSRARSR